MIRHVSSVAEIVEDVDAAIAFYEGLGLAVKREAPGYGVVEVPGILHFGVWSRRDAAESTFGDPEATDRVPLGFTIGFEVDDVDEAGARFGGTVLRGAVDEPWGQRTLRFRSPSGAVCEFSAAPWARELETNVSAKAAEVTS
jgi:catechol 2,3-dioxygenase-like lactoylglutathione lyase family enzyme